MSQQTKTYTLGLENNWIQCHLCGRVSFHRGDIENVYCGHCHHFHLGDLPGHQHGTGGRLSAESRAVQGKGTGAERALTAALPPKLPTDRTVPVPNLFSVETFESGDVQIRSILGFPIITLKPYEALNLSAWLAVAVDPDGHQFELLVKQIKQT